MLLLSRLPGKGRGLWRAQLLGIAYSECTSPGHSLSSSPIYPINAIARHQVILLVCFARRLGYPASGPLTGADAHLMTWLSKLGCVLGHDPRGHEVVRLPMYLLSLGNESMIGPVPVMRSARAEPSWANQGRRHRQSGDRFSDEMRAYVNPITKRLRAEPFVMVQESFQW